MNNFRKMFFATAAAVMTLCAGVSTVKAQTAAEEQSGASQDSMVSVIGWFSKNDTADYEISESQWRINGSDTVLRSATTSTVRIVVKDSTADGYKMDYTFLDFKIDTIADTNMKSFETEIADKIWKKLKGTTIHFETNDCGTITKINNLREVKRRAKSMMNDAMKTLAEMPEIKKMEKAGIDIMKVKKSFNTDNIVDGYLNDLNLLFMFHGLAFKEGLNSTTEKATETTPEIKTQTDASTDGETTEINYLTESAIPAEKIKAMLGDMVDSVVKGGAKGLDSVLDSALTADGYQSQYIVEKYTPTGWPYEVVSQKSLHLMNEERLTQTQIHLTGFGYSRE